MALARAVAASGHSAYLIDADNKVVGHIERDGAVRSGKPFFVMVHEGMLAADFDGPTAEADADRLYLDLRLNGYGPVLVASGQAGRRHVFSRLGKERREGVEANRSTYHYDARRTIRPPLAPHRFGEPTSILAPVSVEEALLRLEPGWIARTPSDDIRRMIERGQPQDKSSYCFSVAKSLVNAGWTLEEFFLLLETPGRAVSRIYASRVEDRGRGRSRLWIAKEVWPKAVREVEENPARSQVSDRPVRRMLAGASAMPWHGELDAIVRVVYLALIAKYLKCGWMPFNASERELAELAGVSRATVSDRLRRLERAGLVTLVSRGAIRDGARHSSSWQLQPQYEHDPLVDTSMLDHLNHPAFSERGGLGKTTQHVFDLLRLTQETTVAYLAQRSGQSRSRVRTALRSLAEHGLATKHGHRWEAANGSLVDLLDEVADRLGCAERPDKQHSLYEVERTRAPRGIK
ncbi:MAG: winged helix-turn-helix transcriptional regulator [Nocardioidaceae bacterium]